MQIGSQQLSSPEVGRLPSLVDIQTVSQSLGVSMRQVRRFVADGQIPFVRVGHLIRFDPDELHNWIDARRAGTAQSGWRKPRQAAVKGDRKSAVPKVGEANP